MQNFIARNIVRLALTPIFWMNFAQASAVAGETPIVGFQPAIMFGCTLTFANQECYHFTITFCMVDVKADGYTPLRTM